MAAHLASRLCLLEKFDREVAMLENLTLALALGGLGAIIGVDLYVRTVCELERWRARRRR